MCIYNLPIKKKYCHHFLTNELNDLNGHKPYILREFQLMAFASDDSSLSSD